MQSKVEQAVAIIRKSSHLGDWGLIQALIAAGSERRLAARMVEFVPSAYFRVLYGPKGYKFTDTFRRIGEKAKLPLATEPVWQAALDCATSEVKRGVSREEMEKIAELSGEYALAVKLEWASDIEFGSLLLGWPEEGPFDD